MTKYIPRYYLHNTKSNLGRESPPKRGLLDVHLSGAGGLEEAEHGPLREIEEKQRHPLLGKGWKRGDNQDGGGPGDVAGARRLSKKEKRERDDQSKIDDFRCT